MSSTKPGSFFRRDWPGPLYFQSEPQMVLELVWATMSPLLQVPHRSAPYTWQKGQRCSSLILNNLPPGNDSKSKIWRISSCFSTTVLCRFLERRCENCGATFFSPNTPGATSKLWGTALPDGRPGPCVVGAWRPGRRNPLPQTGKTSFVCANTPLCHCVIHRGLFA